MMRDFQAMKSRLESEIGQRMLDISGHKVKLYWMDTTILNDAAVFEAAYWMLPRWRREKADFYLRASDRRRSVGAGLLLQRGLADCKADGTDGQIAFGQYGKPCLPAHPEIHFNLSHGGNLAAAVFADTDVGCDVERTGQADMALAERFFCAGEYIRLMRLQEGEERNEAFYRLWTLKESFVKAVGLGLGKLPPDTFEIELQPDGSAKLWQQADESAYGFWGHCGEGMCLGVCVRMGDMDIDGGRIKRYDRETDEEI